MCLVILAHQVIPDYPLVVAANRDEFHARPTAPSRVWEQHPELLAGQDLEQGGTWMGVTRSGRFAAITNYRDPDRTAPAPRSRGELPLDFLLGGASPGECMAEIAASAADYAGFNLLLGDGRELWYMSNSESRANPGARCLSPGIYGLSNAALDTPWSKVERSKASLRLAMEQGSLDETALFDILGDRRKGPAAEAETDRLPFASAHALTAPFVTLPGYGTRSSSIVIRDADANWKFVERRFGPDGSVAGETRQSFPAQE